MSSKHDNSYAKRNVRLAGVFLASLAMVGTGMAVGIADADARGGGGGGAARAGGGGGRMAHSSVSGANHAAGYSRGGGANKGNYNSGSANRGNVNSGNVNSGRVNAGNVNTGNVNTGNVNRGNINTGNVNIGNDVNIDIDGGYGHGGYYHHPIAAGITIGAVAVTTAAVMGSYYHALPPGCATVYRGGLPYYYCGSVYYQQSWSGNDVVYVVVNP